TRHDSTKKILIFTTDGDPNLPPEFQEIINSVIAAGITVYAITVGNNMNPELGAIAENTGGRWYENVREVQELEAIYRQVALLSRGEFPCALSWWSTKACGPNPPTRHVEVSYDAPTVSREAQYTVPDHGVITLQT